MAVHVVMTKDIFDRPPKIAGLFTKRQLVGVVIAAACAALAFTLIKVRLEVRLLLTILAAFPSLLIAFYQPTEISISAAVKYGVKKTLFGTEYYINDGQTRFYHKKAEENDKIKRHNDYKGVQ